MYKHKKQSGIRAIAAVVLILLCVSLMAGCSLFPGQSASRQDDARQDSDIQIIQRDGGKVGKAESAIFDQFMDELFAEWVASDTLSMQVYLAYPEAMGIERPVPTYGAVMSPELWREEREDTARIEERLAAIEYDKLSGDRQVTYDIISRNIELSKILEEKEDYSYYTGYIEPVIGWQVQLPVVLAEFNFYTEEDIEIYLGLLSDTIRFFDDIIEFERERAARGFFMSDANLDTVIEQLETFLEEREDNFIIEVVNDKIGAFPGLSQEQYEQYKSKNRELVLGNVLVAYDNLLEAMRSLRGVGANPGGLAALPDGERVAHAMLRYRAGTDMSVEELMDTIGEWRERTLWNARMILANDNEIMEKYFSDEVGEIPYGTPEEYMDMLQDVMLKDFPPIGAIDYSIREVHESLREFISPAFFFIPAVDYFDNNVIYINPAKFGTEPGDNLDIFTAMAHEGYPGHMYQMVYFRQSSPHPIRLLLSNTGYSEGWATYVEQVSYGYAGLDELEAVLMRELNLYFLLLQAHIDLGVNLLGWGTREVAELLHTDLGINDEETVSAYFDSVTGMPLNISIYAIGYMEMQTLRELSELEKGDDFSLIDFHKFILEFGPAPFPLIKQHMP